MLLKYSNAASIHIISEIRKALSKIAKDIQQWVKPCEKHLYWSAMTTFDGNGRVIWAKFKSFLSHIVNKHSALDDPFFNKCAHGEIPDRKWLDSGRSAFFVIMCFVMQSMLVYLEAYALIVNTESYTCDIQLHFHVFSFHY